jgi:drug/metabolite transporter (DMT)-like permease
LWNEAITLIGAKNGLDLLFNPVFSGVLAYFFKPSHCLTQIISMVIIITGLLLTNKKA